MPSPSIINVMVTMCQTIIKHQFLNVALRSVYFHWQLMLTTRMCECVISFYLSILNYCFASRWVIRNCFSYKWFRYQKLNGQLNAQPLNRIINGHLSRWYMHAPSFIKTNRYTTDALQAGDHFVYVLSYFTEHTIIVRKKR